MNKYFKQYIVLVVILVSVWFIPNVSNSLQYKEFSQLLKVQHFESVRSAFLYQFGVSADPRQVILGDEDFLFLGQHYDWSLNQYRNVVDYNQQELLLSNRHYERFSTLTGIPLLFNLIPSKVSIYSEYASWKMLNDQEPMDGVRQAIKFEGSIIVSSYDELLKSKSKGLLYYKWDTHWNEYGAFIDYLNVIDSLNRKYALNIKAIDDYNLVLNSYPSDSDMLFPKDLAEMLKLSYYGLLGGGEFNDYWELISLEKPLGMGLFKLNTTSLEEEKDDSVHENIAVDVNYQPYITRTLNSDNQQKVLWIRDSFGKASSKLYQSTFSEIVSIHPRHLNKELLVNLQSKYEFDLIIISLAERQALAYFKKLAPFFNELKKNTLVKRNKAINTPIPLEWLEFSDNIALDDGGRYKSVSLDPQILVQNLDSLELNGSCELNIEINSDNESLLQVFYRDKYQNFSELRSYSQNLKSGSNFATFLIPTTSEAIRIDPLYGQGAFDLSNLNFMCFSG